MESAEDKVVADRVIGAHGGAFFFTGENHFVDKEGATNSCSLHWQQLLKYPEAGEWLVEKRSSC